MSDATGAARIRRATSTTNFGSGRREAHDASAFYDRFVPPRTSTDTTIERSGQIDVIHHHDARSMDAVASSSVALVVTSPPYFAGKQYEEDLGVDGVPATYFEYLQLLRDVFSECDRVLEPGGRIAVNVANLGRRPYRSLSGDVTQILQDLGLLLRGEVVWWKGRAAGGSCAWGSFQRPANPVLRDITERVVIAGKGRFDRALTPAQRRARHLPWTATISREEFMEATTDLWEIAPERATRVGHPAPFPVGLPQRLIELYTYASDVILDPFMGSGSTAVASVRSGRRYIGYETDATYVRQAERRVADERLRLQGAATRWDVTDAGATAAGEDPWTRAVSEGRRAAELAHLLLERCGFTDIRADVSPRGLGITLSFVAADGRGRDWAFEVAGSLTTNDAGLRRSDTLWRSLAKASVLHESALDLPLVVVTTAAPAPSSAGHRALAAVRGPGRPIRDVIGLLTVDDHARLRALASSSRPA